MQIPRIAVLLTSLLLVDHSRSLQAEPPAAGTANWPQWRGPFANGVAASDSQPPVSWAADRNMAWTLSIPGSGSATPAVWEDQVFVLSAEETTRKAPARPAKADDAKTEPPDVLYRFLVTSVSRQTGHVLWQRVAAEDVPHEGRHSTHTYAAGSPATDGKRLFASFGSRGLFCYSLSGEQIWHVDLGDMRTRFGWGEAVTPAIAGDRLIVNWDQEDNSFITALDSATGREVWRKERPGEATSWNTPLVVDIGGRLVVIVNGSGKARAYEAESGEVLWECGGQTINAIPSPVRFQDSVICMSGYRGAAAMAIPLNVRGDVSDSPAVIWRHAAGTPYVPSPVLSNNRLCFTAGNSDVLTILDAADGKPLLEHKRLGIGNVYASPVAANGFLFFLGREGSAVVLRDDTSGEIVSTNRLTDTFDASPVVIGKQLFLRSWSRLYCIEEQGNQ